MTIPAALRAGWPPPSRGIRVGMRGETRGVAGGRGGMRGETRGETRGDAGGRGADAGGDAGILSVGGCLAPRVPSPASFAFGGVFFLSL